MLRLTLFDSLRFDAHYVAGGCATQFRRRSGDGIYHFDIGLHYTALVDMWRMVKQTAEKLDVQVFATTHSRDCIDALAAIARPDVTTGSEVTIQRIEGERAVSYSEREIVLAAERGIEVR